MRKVILTIIIFFAIIALLAYLPIEQWVGDGRGDWEKVLCNGYTITKLNNHQIVLTYPQNDYSSIDIIENFYVTAYQNCDPYILVKGIPTQDGSLSENDVDKGILVYYFIDSLEHSITGPFESFEKLQDYCNEHSMTIFNNWEKTIVGIKKTKNGLRIDTIDG